MEARFAVAIPVGTAASINDRLAQMRDDLTRQIHATEKKIRSGSAKALEERKGLIAKLNRLTPTNVIRVAVMMGTDSLVKLPNEEIAERVAKNGLVRGRKKHAA